MPVWSAGRSYVPKPLNHSMAVGAIEWLSKNAADQMKMSLARTGHVTA